MEKKISKIIIIMSIIVAIIVLVIIGIMVFKQKIVGSEEDLFKKYISQNAEALFYILDFKEEDEQIKKLKESDYVEMTKGTLSYLENENDEEEEYTISEGKIVRNSEDKVYGKLLFSYGDERLATIETLKLDNVYGIRFSNLVKQYVSIKNSNLQYIANSLGYDGEYVTDKISGIDFSGLLKFTPEELELLKTTYGKVLFTDIDKSKYSSKKDEIITLTSGESPSTTSYTLTLTQEDLDKIIKRFLNQLAEDEIILSRVDLLDEKLQNAGFNTGKIGGLRQSFIKKLKEESEKIEYNGEDTRKVIIKVNQKDGKTIRTSMKKEDEEVTIELSSTDTSKSFKIKTISLTEDAEKSKNYVIGKQENGSNIKRTLTYYNSTDDISLITEMQVEDEKINLKTNIDYSNGEISNIGIDANTEITVRKCT